MRSCRLAVTRWFLLTLGTSAAALLLAAAAAPPRHGTIVDAPANPVDFAPAGDAVVVDAETVNLSQIFEDLGPIATQWYQHVQTLADPFFEGRAPATSGMDRAAEYLEYYFRQYGLQPAFPDPSAVQEQPGGAVTEGSMVSYRQPFEFNYGGSRMRARVGESVLAIGEATFTLDEDYTVLGVSGSDEVTAPLAFVGYGIENGPDGYASFDADTDLTGRIAVLLRYEPIDEDGHSRWAERRFSRNAGMSGKLRAVRERGAVGILLVTPPGAVEAASGLEPVSRSSQFGRPMPIPAMHITPELADRLLRAADPAGQSLDTWRRLADEGDVRTVMLKPDVQITMGAEVERGGARVGVETENIGAVLPGQGALADEWIVIGAHYDHVGMGEFGSSPQNRGQLHPGADDNASGTAGLLILAKTLSEYFAESPVDADRRSILFIGFSAEESGLHGSRAFTQNPSIPGDSITAMLNMDMIGRVRGNNVTVMGTGTAEGLEDILRPHFEASGLTVAVSPGTSGRSDDANFINIEVPAMHFFSGMHREYHSPADQAYTVNPAGARDVLALIHEVAVDLSTRPEKLVFTTPQPRERAEREAPTRDRGYGPVRLGIRPGMGEDLDRGVLIEDVSPGTSAAEAGLQPGDIVLGWNDYSIDGMRGLFEQLQKHKPGDVVLLTVQRGEEELRIECTLKSSDGE